MTQEEKDLLLKDICARLPYDIKVYDNNGNFNTSYVNLLHINGKVSEAFVGNGMQCRTAPIDEIRPYIFPLSSMSEDQKYEFYLKFIAKDCDFDYFKFYLDNGKWHKLITSLLAVEEIIDWFHKNHIDYRGLIPMGLAIDATGLNIY